MSALPDMRAACAAVGIDPPRRLEPGRWLLADVIGKANGRGDGRVRIDPDGRSGVAWNHQTGQHARWRDGGLDVAPMPVRDREADRKAVERQREAAALCEALVKAAKPAGHPYLARKGFRDERMLVLPETPDLRGQSLGDMEGPYLLVPGWIGKALTTVQIVGACGTKLNIRSGRMSGASYRIAPGAPIYVCEGIATALTVRAALRMLGRQAGVVSAFAANNVCKVAQDIQADRDFPDSVVMADHDKVNDAFGVGTGEHYARQSGRPWLMPPALGDFNDMHQAEGLRAVAVLIREKLA